MNKAPAFQFYASDFLVDTAEMTNQEVGAYIRLLSHQWVNGSLNSDPNRLANVVGIDLLDVWDDIKHKFDICEDGKLRNPKLEEVRKTQIDYRAKQSAAGKRGAAKRWDSNPNGNPISKPNNKNIALRSSSSSSKDLKPMSCKQDGIIKVLEFLNEKSGKKFKPVESNLKLIRARLKEGHTAKDMESVINRKCKEWSENPDMVQYLRPATLFNAEKFNQYVGELGAPLPPKKVIREDWETLPRGNEQLWNWAKKHGFQSPGTLTFDQYRYALQREVDKKVMELR